MITNTINFFTVISENEGFGINTDIFETNIINLSVVIGVLIYYGRAALNDLINNRRETILQSLQEADNKFREAEENLRFASENLNSAKLKAQQIRTQGNVLAQKTYESVLETIESDIKRLEAVSLSTIRFEEDKSMNEVCQKLWDLTSKKALQIIKKRIRINPKFQKNFHKKVVKRYTKKLTIFKKR